MFRWGPIWLSLLVCLGLRGQGLEMSRPMRSWEFMDQVGTRAAILGKEDGTVEAWVFPLKLFGNFRLEFRFDGHTIPAASVARRVVVRPGSYSIIYSGDEFQVTEKFVVPADQPGALIVLNVQADTPLEIIARFHRDFQLMWPASMGSGYIQWEEGLKGFYFGADGETFAGVIASPQARLVNQEYGTNYSSSTESAFSLGEVNGKAEWMIAIAGSVKSREEALATGQQFVSGYRELAAATDHYYEDYLKRTVSVAIPDKELQEAYDWARVSVLKGLVNNPILGQGLVAGWGPSKGGYRPGFGWFFGRDSFWTSLALTAVGDLATSRAAIDFVARFQREDGKIPHEISQSASLVNWFTKYPYGFASADATPLYLIAVRDYVEVSGDVEFAKSHWERLNKAMSFMRANMDPAGFPKNFGVGHGWVEGGPLLPVRTEFYQAGVYVEAVRSLSRLAALLGKPDEARRWEQEYGEKRGALDKIYWLPETHCFAFAIGQDGKPVDQPTVLTTVPMWFGVTDPEHTGATLRQLKEESHAADWGMRIISSKAAFYNPAGYHYGSVWPLFTGWASVGEYRYHADQAGFANLKANAALTLDGGAGNTTEVLSGASYSPLSTSSAHQIWSAAMVISPLLRGLFGLTVNVPDHTVTLRPHIPAGWGAFEIGRVPVGQAFVDFRFSRQGEGGFSLEADNTGTATLKLEFAPALAPCTEIVSAALNGATAKWEKEAAGNDWHARFSLEVKPGKSTLSVRLKNSFGFSVAPLPLQLGAPSRNLKVLSEEWSDARDRVELTVSGRPGNSYQMSLYGAAKAASVSGAKLSLDGRSLRVEFPGDSREYASRKVEIVLKHEP